MKNLLKSANKYELFDIYEMFIEDYYNRQHKLINKQIENYINKTYVDIRDLYKGEKGTTQIQSSSKKVAKINIETNEIIEIYDTIALAARENNCDNSAISKVCRGLRNKCGGFKWQYIENS